MLLALIFIITFSVDSQIGPLKPGDYLRSLDIGKEKRTYLVHLPPSYDPNKPMPVVLAYHGGATSARIMVTFSGLNGKSDEAGFMVVYPNGTGLLENALTFNAGNCCGYAMRNDIDDIGFTRALLDDLSKVANIDSKRIYATGISNGGMMCYLLASELSDRIAAIAPVGGPMGTEKCHPREPVSIIHFHGEDDQFAPFKGGHGTGVSGTDFYSVEYSILSWVKANGCPETPEITQLPDKVDDGTAVTRKRYGPGKEGSEVILYAIKGGGHTWPGRESRMDKLGKTTKEISANDLMWEFFKKHPKKK